MSGALELDRAKWRTAGARLLFGDGHFDLPAEDGALATLERGGVHANTVTSISAIGGRMGQVAAPVCHHHLRSSACTGDRSGVEFRGTRRRHDGLAVGGRPAWHRVPLHGRRPLGALTTMTAVGYGDQVPGTTSGRALEAEGRTLEARLDARLDTLDARLAGIEKQLESHNLGDDTRGR